MQKPINQNNIAEIGRIILDKMVRPAIQIIRDESHNIKVTEKVHYDGVKADIATNGDKKTQEHYLKQIAAFFPGFGIIAEEGDLARPCTLPDANVYFTIDPLDGTKAYDRGSSQGVGTMISLIQDGQAVVSYIGDVNTGEIFGYADMEQYGPVMREKFGAVNNMEPNLRNNLIEQYVLLRAAPRKQPKLITEMIRDPKDGGLFREIEVSGGGIGLACAKIWKGELGAMVFEPNYTTPWDLAPVLAISLRMGFIFYKINDDGSVTEHIPEFVTETIQKPYSEIMVHRNHKKELETWMEENK